MLYSDLFSSNAQADAISDGAVKFVYADNSAKISDGCGLIASSSHTCDGRHARVVPAVDKIFLDQSQKFAFAHNGIGEIEAGEFDLLRMIDAKLIEEPVI